MPQRFLRPGITNSELWNSVSFPAQSLFIRIITLVDDYGRYDGRSTVLWAHCFAVWNEKQPNQEITLQEFDKLLQEIAAVHLIDLYEVSGKRILQVSQWLERVREGTKEKWPKNPTCSEPLRNPAESCGILPPPPSPSPSPSPARAPSEPAFPEVATPSWDEFWKHCQTISMHGERYARDKFLAAEQKNWQNSPNWKAYAGRVKGWWESDGKPMEKIEAKTPPKPSGPKKFMKKWGIDNPPTRQECVDDGQFDSFHQMWRLMFAEELKKRAVNGAHTP